MAIEKFRAHLGVVGGIASGKSTICRILERLGFRVVALSDLIVEEGRARGIALATRGQYFELGEEMRSDYGRDILARLAVNMIRGRGWRDFVVEGIRTTEEATFLRKAFPDLLLIGIETHLEERLRRVKARARYIDSTEEKLILEDITREDLGNRAGCEVSAVMRITDTRLSGELSLAKTVASLVSVIGRNKD